MPTERTFLLKQDELHLFEVDGDFIVTLGFNGKILMRGFDSYEDAKSYVNRAARRVDSQYYKE